MNQKSLMFAAIMMVTAMFGVVTVYHIRIKQKLEHMATTPVQDWPEVEKVIAPEVPAVIHDTVDEEQQIVADTYKEAIEKSKSLNKQVLVFFSAGWCGVCQRMKNEVLSDNKVKESMKNYIFVTVNIDKNRDLVRKYDLRSIPAYLITNKNQEQVKLDKGFKDVDSFVKWLANPGQTKIKRINLSNPRKN